MFCSFKHFIGDFWTFLAKFRIELKDFPDWESWTVTIPVIVQYKGTKLKNISRILILTEYDLPRKLDDAEIFHFTVDSVVYFQFV